MSPLVVTGATGFLGRHVGRELVRRNTPFRVFVRSPARAADYERDGVPLTAGDLRDAAACRAAVQGARAVLHLAAAADVSDPAVNRAVNVDGLGTLLQACRDEGVHRFVFVSSTCAARPLRDAYGETKRLGEELVRASGLDATILRPTMIYGRGSKEFDTFVGTIRWSPVVPIIGPGTNVVQPVWVGDAVPTLLDVVGSEATSGRTYDLAGPHPVTFDGLVQLVARVIGRRRVILHVPAAPVLLAARVLGRLSTHVPLTVDQVMAFLQNTEVDIAPLRAAVGFAPRPIAEGLARALAPEKA